MSNSQLKNGGFIIYVFGYFNFSLINNLFNNKKKIAIYYLFIVVYLVFKHFVNYIIEDLVYVIDVLIIIFQY